VTPISEADRASEPDAASEADAALAEVVRSEAGLIVGTINRQIRDFDVAEEAVHDAVLVALRTWRRDGVPDRPGAWLTVAARRNAVDLLRRRAREERATHALADQTEDLAYARASAKPDVADDRLPMLFACCHPSLAVESRLALTLRAVVGVPTPEIARAFLVPEATVAQRIVRAKRKIVAARIPMRVPAADQLQRRLDDVLTVAYLAYNAGYLRRPGDSGRHVAADAIWLAELVAAALPKEPEAWGLLALLTLLEARAPARFDVDGRLVLLPEQDRSTWDSEAVERAESMLLRASTMNRTGRYQLQAAIAACHTAATSWEETDWLQILTLYDVLVARDRSPVIRLNRAIALSHVRGPGEALAEIDALAEDLGGYHLLHSTRGYLLAELGRDQEALAAYRAALVLTTNPVEQDVIRVRIAAET
jgi:RNA polymerase sigma factor (sigma-70 family)